MVKLKVTLLVNWLAQQNFSCGETTAQGCISKRNIRSGHIQFISAKVVDSSNPALSDFDYNWHSWSLVKREAQSGFSLRFQSFVYLCCLHIASSYQVLVLAWHDFTLNQYPGIMIIYSPARMHSLRLAIYESSVLQLLKQEAILSAHSVYKVMKTVFTLQYNCLPEAHSFHPTEHSRYFHL